MSSQLFFREKAARNSYNMIVRCEQQCLRKKNYTFDPPGSYPVPSAPCEERCMLHHLTYMLMIWGVQALVLLIGLFCLILFGARLYCDNYRDRIACRLIEGHSLLSCIRTHLVLTVLYYGAVAAGLLFLKLAIELDYNILLGTFLAEMLITLLACGSIARKNLYQIVKGAEA